MIDRALPHKLPTSLKRVPWAQCGLNLVAALGELRVTAHCAILLDADFTLTAALSIGTVAIDGTKVEFRSSRDWARLDELGEGSTSCEVQCEPAGAILTFGPGSRSGQCCLTSISWPVRVPEVGVSPGVVAPPHFFHYLTCTQLGADYLRRSAFVHDRLLGALAGGCEARPARDVRAALWAAGHLGRTQWGLELLLEHNVLPLVVALATGSCRWSLRVTAHYCLALVGSNPLAAEPLGELGWEAHARAPGVVRPWPAAEGGGCGGGPGRDFFEEAAPGPGEAEPPLPGGWSGPGAHGGGGVEMEKALPHAAFGAPHRRVLAQLERLHNTVLQRQACDALEEERRRDPAIFLSVLLWWRVQQCLAGCHSYPLAVRRLIGGLFADTLRSREALELLDTITD